MNMKRTILTLSFVIVAMMATAQQIAVVTGNTTKLCQTLADAIEEASSGSTIYLPGGGFQISDDVKITKKLSIIGIGHKAVSENVDGNTVISGNLFFNEGSSNSVIMGCYISGDVKIGFDEKSVNNILIQYCNLNSVQITDKKASNTNVNQCYIRGRSYFGYTDAIVTNNIANFIHHVVGGHICNNILFARDNRYSCTVWAQNATIANNIFIDWNSLYGGECTITDNMVLKSDWGDACINLGLNSWDGVFKKDAGITPASDFHFIGEYVQYQEEVGIYCTKNGGTGFSDGALPPVPYIVSKIIPEQTDASGKLNIKIRVKAGE